MRTGSTVSFEREERCVARFAPRSAPRFFVLFLRAGGPVRPLSQLRECESNEGASIPPSCQRWMRWTRMPAPLDALHPARRPCPHARTHARPPPCQARPGAHVSQHGPARNGPKITPSPRRPRTRQHLCSTAAATALASSLIASSLSHTERRAHDPPNGPFHCTGPPVAPRLGAGGGGRRGRGRLGRGPPGPGRAEQHARPPRTRVLPGLPRPDRPTARVGPGGPGPGAGGAPASAATPGQHFLGGR